MKSYPAAHVILVFAFSPAIGGIIMVMFMIFLGGMHPSVACAGCNPKEFLLESLGIMIIAMILAVYMQFIPAFALGLLCACIKLKRGIFGYVCTSITGGLAAFLWMHFWIIHFQPRMPITFKPDTAEPNFLAMSLIFGAICALLAAIFVLPEKSSAELRVTVIQGEP